MLPFSSREAGLEIDPRYQKSHVVTLRATEKSVRSVADSDQGYGAFLGLKILKFFDADTDRGSFGPWIRDGKIRIRDLG
jgi:hypothetical protein